MSSINERKLIAIGGSLLVTVPKPWLDFYGLRAGDKVYVVSNGDVTIRLKQKSRKLKKLPG